MLFNLAGARQIHAQHKRAFTGIKLNGLNESTSVQSKGCKTKDIQQLIYGVLSVFKTNRAKQLLQQEKSVGLVSGIISTAAGKLGCWKGK